ncbi:MAG: NHL repeat-containing protein [Planctomycetota bacterium]|jgi:DNA-binding beta-propeller fold protein YncE
MKAYLLSIAFILCAFVAPLNSQSIVNQWGTGGAFAGGLDYDSATDTVWVADSNTDTIYQFKRDGTPITSWAAPDALAIGIAVDPITGNVWIADESETVYEMTPDGATVLDSWSVNPPIVDLSGLALDHITGNIITVQDSGTRQIGVFDQDGNLVDLIDLSASGSSDPDGIGFNSVTGTYFLGDDTGDKVVEVDGNGNALNTWSTSGLGISPEGMGVDFANEMVFISGGFDNTVYEVDGMIDMALTPHFLLVPEGGGAVKFALDAGSGNANRNYLIVGGTSGTSPGTILPGGMVLPVTWDWFSDLEMALLGSGIFDNFLGALDADGKAGAKLNVPPLPAGTAGVLMHYAYCCNNPFDFVSNPVPILIIP